jgi:hypothetical protein
MSAKKYSSLKGQGIGLKGQVLMGLRGRIWGLKDRIWNGLEDLGLVGELQAVASGRHKLESSKLQFETYLVPTKPLVVPETI